MLCVQAGQEGVLGVLTLILGSGLVFKQRKRIKDPTENIPAPGIGGRVWMDAELAAAFRFPGGSGAGRKQLYLNLPQNLKLVTDLVLLYKY